MWLRSLPYSGLLLAALLLLVVRGARARARLSLSWPRVVLPFSQARARIRTGDMLLTRSSGNNMSQWQSTSLQTPITHVGIAVVEREGDALTRVFMFEAGAVIGVQLRDLEDYVADGVEHVWWRPAVRRLDRDAVMRTLERRARSPYSWEFLHEMPSFLLGTEGIAGLHERERERPQAFDHQRAVSCGDLVADVYTALGCLEPLDGVALPMHFLDDEALPWRKGMRLGEPVQLLFDDLRSVDDRRLRKNVQRLALTLAAMNTHELRHI